MVTMDDGMVERWKDGKRFFAGWVGFFSLDGLKHEGVCRSRLRGTPGHEETRAVGSLCFGTRRAYGVKFWVGYAKR